MEERTVEFIGWIAEEPEHIGAIIAPEVLEQCKRANDGRTRETSDPAVEGVEVSKSSG